MKLLDIVISKMFVLLLQKNINCGNAKNFKVTIFYTESSPKQKLRQLFPSDLQDLIIRHHKWVSVQSSKYTRGVFVLIEYI